MGLAKNLDMGVEAMSLFELLLSKEVGFNFNHIVFNGPAKTREELELCINNGIRYLNVESMNELQMVESNFIYLFYWTTNSQTMCGK